eukprot:SAG11_NODE_1170_length_5614_cov_4.941795_4_plen_166_part_00
MPTVCGSGRRPVFAKYNRAPILAGRVFAVFAKPCTAPWLAPVGAHWLCAVRASRCRAIRTRRGVVWRGGEVAAGVASRRVCTCLGNLARRASDTLVMLHMFVLGTWSHRCRGAFVCGRNTTMSAPSTLGVQTSPLELEKWRYRRAALPATLRTRSHCKTQRLCST